MYDEFFSKAHELLDDGTPFVTATVVRAEKPTSGKPGDKAIVTPEGVMHGWIGGSCASPAVIKEARNVLAEREPRLIRLSTEPDQQTPRDGLLDLPMTCFSGGTLEIYLEPHFPLTRLVVIGNLPVAQALVQLGKAMNYQVIAVDPDNDGAGMDQADQIITDLKAIGEKVNSLTYVVVASHGHYDEIALEHALRSKARYVGLVASRKRAASVREYLTVQGLSDDDFAKLKYPAGLDIKARRGDEIALSIVAEIVQLQRTAEPLEVDKLIEDITAAQDAVEAIDPVCGMTVEIATAQHVSEYHGQMFYFCCGGCKSSFEADPAQYLDQPTPSGEAIDPICHMTVDIASAKFMSEYEGEFYYFCCGGCKSTFDKEPEKYLAVA